MTRSPRMTLQTLLVLREMLKDPDCERFGLELSRDTGQPTGTIYPIIVRLERCGWVESAWEPPERHLPEGRRRRRYYKLTKDGAQRAREAVAAAERSRGGLVNPVFGEALP
ncbi:helix-turn-helix transcriptional regulator [Spirillospora sp. NPDC047279]|uniref:PadR family transcriptional regulator n=1 Tax=Spirillospora sp. NPDC047279 TaxID=3155478 RepID=UPI0033CDE976